MSSHSTERPGVAIYARCSGHQQAEKDLSIPAQLDACRTTAEARGWNIVAEYVDAAETARTDDRPQFQEMLAEARSKGRPFQYILVWKFSRFARSREISVLHKRQLERHGVRVVSLNEPVDDSPAGRMLEGMLEVIDEFYSANLAQDIARGMRKNATMGFRNGGTTPIGYKTVRTGPSEGCPRMKLVPDPDWAPLVQRMFRMALDGMGVTLIAKTLNGEGLQTRRGMDWTKTTVMAVLKNEVYSGVTVFGAQRMKGSTVAAQPTVRLDNTHEAVVESERFKAVQTLLRSRSRGVGSPAANRGAYLLSGLLYCSVCASPLIGHPAKGGSFHYYGCQRKLKQGASACTSQLINRDAAEAAVLEAIAARILAPTTVDEVSSQMGRVQGERARARAADQSAHRARVLEIRRQRERLLEAVASGAGSTSIVGRLKETDARLAAIEAAPAPADHSVLRHPIDDLATELARTLAEMRPIQKRAVARAWLRRAEGSGGTTSVCLHRLIRDDAS